MVKIMDKNKILIVGLIVVIVALIAGIAMMLTGNGNSSDVEVPEGMQEYNFNSAFTMVVNDDAKFLKTWNSSLWGLDIDYYNKNDNYAVKLSESDNLIGIEDDYIDLINSSKNYDISKDGELYVCKVDKSKKFDVCGSQKHFDYRVLILHGNKEVIISGDDLDSIKEMASTIKFRE